MDKKTSVFPSPYDIGAPNGAEDWREMYPYYMQFQPHMRAEEEGKFWFLNTQQWPVPLRPFDTLQLEYSGKVLGQYNTRHLRVPPANGVECRIINGYVYASFVPVPPEEIEERVPIFMDRAGYYYSNWNELLENWKKKVLDNIDALDAIHFAPLPEISSDELFKSGLGTDDSSRMMADYDRVMDLFHNIWQYHFEFLNLGYAAYVDFFTFVKGQFPSLADQTIAKMVQGVDSVLFQPDQEMKKLAQRAVDLGLTAALQANDVTSVLAAMKDVPNGPKWIAEWEAAKDPWFNFSTGSGLLSSDKRWRDDHNIPMGYIRDYAARIAAGEEVMRPTKELQAERDRVTAEYRDLMDPEAQEMFDQKLGLSRMVFPYVEDHNFYIEHWSMGAFWRKMREMSALLCDAGFWPDEDGMFFLRRAEAREAIWDYINAWATGCEPHGTGIWPNVVAKRRKMLDALLHSSPVPALNNPPESMNEPFTVMLWGITDEAIKKMADSMNDTGNTLSGMAASPGVVEGIARVLRDPEQLGELQAGEILVATVTAPSWAPIFGKISAAVTDIGGIMSHAAIVCREYGLPAVTGTSFATAKIKTGMRLQVDGNTGSVTILDA